MIQVVDGDTDSIVADIPVDGWTRESDFSADGRFLYVSARRHLIHKIDLVTNQVVNTINVNSDGWERFIYGFSLAPDGDSAYVNLLSRRSAVYGDDQPSSTMLRRWPRSGTSFDKVLIGTTTSD